MFTFFGGVLGAVLCGFSFMGLRHLFVVRDARLGSEGNASTRLSWFVGVSIFATLFLVGVMLIANQFGLWFA